MHKDNAEQINEILNDASFHIARNVNPKITLMDTMLKIALIFTKK